MNIYAYLYLMSILLLLPFNLSIYDKSSKGNINERLSYLFALFVMVFLGPISIVINLYYIGVYIKYRIRKYLHYREMHKVLSAVIEESLFKALEENGIQVVDK